MSNNEYDVTQYSDEDCYRILELNNPTDRELEMKILQMMDKYEGKSKRLYQFFESMYDRFFSEEEQEQDNVVEGFVESEAKTAEKELKQAPGKPTPKELPTQGAIEVNTVDYVKDKMSLNPVERKTIFKMISVDSQFRDDPTNTSSTNFTMNLSEGIENVISMKLYSVQIPYTWYTVNESFGSNFFYIKGNSPGINNGNHDIKVEIRSGTYSPTDIINAINSRFDFLKNKSAIKTYIANNPLDTKYNPALDTSFGETKVSYNLNANNAKVVFEFDLLKQFDETNYELYFPTSAIPNFLGFTQNTYRPFIAYSMSNVLPPVNASDPVTGYYIDNSNNYFTVRQYIGTNTILEFPVTFSLPPNANYTRTQLIVDLNTQLQANQYVDSVYSYVTRTNDSSGNNSIIKIAVKLNRTNTQQIENTKLDIIFPNETQIGNHIWTGATSCFAFPDTNVIQLNEIVSEKKAEVTNYDISLNQEQIRIECTKPYYDVSENVRIATVPASTGSGYLLNDYTAAVNQGLATMNASTINPYQPNGEFNINENANVYSTGFFIESNLPTLKFDILRKFTQTTYIVDLSNCFLKEDIFKFDSSINYLTDTSFVLTRTHTTQANITINSTNNKLVLRPKQTGGLYGQGFGNQNAPVITFEFTTGTYSNYAEHITNEFRRFVDSDGDNIMTGSSLTINGNQISLRLEISKNLTETNYRVKLIGNSWKNNLKFDPSNNPPQYNSSNGYYDLSYNIIGTDPHATITANGSVISNIVRITTLNNKFIFKPFVDGVASGNGANDIVFELPINNEGIRDYTRTDMLEEINKLLAANSIANGSLISVININNQEYTKIRMNINKKYTAKDYKLVFYDAVSFVYCNVGVTQNVTWDSTLGWLMGFHSFTEYALGDFLQITTESYPFENYRDNVFNDDPTGYVYSYNATTNRIALIGDTVLNTNLYNYFLVVLDDFIQNHVNAGLITISSLENDLALPSYAVRATYQCDPVTGVKTAVSASNKLNTSLNSKQLYAMNQIVEARRTKTKSYATGPYLKDVFALIPMKLTGMSFGQTYMEFGGTMQNQDRKYFGPVRIQKLSVKLMNDKGAVLNLNGANWSFCLICEIMNKQ